MKFLCRQFDREGTEREVEVDDPDYAVDQYAHSFIKWHERAVSFIQVKDGEGWITWDVECVRHYGKAFVLRCEITTEERARKEIDEMLKGVN
jgi:hypothetical protein